ncbi:MAG TPA: transglutaminase family protein [Phycisphaerae bacterium]|nr:transglutaminase family protein [Phycisphaerae bacterium]HRR86017.1 transglutaminase family protein [Phycisphaerae bacterium]
MSQSIPASHYDLLAMTPEQLAKIDVALVNLLCAKGLPGAENLDIPAILAKLDEWAAKVKFETLRHLYRVTDPRYAEHYNHSEARLRAEFIVQCLQEDCGVRYNPDRIYEPDFRDSRDMFLHGMLPGANGGTCASMPVMYVAIGRRLGYPMKLVATREHLFCRWDDGKERFNIEGATNGGVSYHPDEYYRSWPKPLSEADMATGVFLTSMSPEAELADFLHHRGMCMHQNGRLTEARAAFAEAHRLQPRDTNTFTALRVVCGAVPRPRYAQNPAAEAWQYGPRPPDPDDPTAQIYQQMTGPSVGTYGQPVQPGAPTQHQPGIPNYSGHPGVPGQPQQPGFAGQHQTGYPNASR